MQEALARAWERGERGHEIENLPGWVTTVAMNLSRSTLRRRRAEARAHARVGASVPEHRTPEDLVDLERAIAALPRRQREAVACRYYLQLPVAEAAGALGVSEGTIKTSLHRARASLADRLRLEPERSDEPEESNRA